MAETAKYTPINGGTLITDLKTHFSVLKTKRTVACAYGFVLVFIVVTTFLAFSPSNNPSSPWFTNIFSLNKEENGSYRSHFSSIFSNLFPKSSQQVENSSSNVPRTSNNKFEQPHLDKEPSIGQKTQNYTQNNESFDKAGVLEKPLNLSVNVPINSSVLSNKESSVVKNQTQSTDFDDKVGILKANHSTIQAPKSPATVNETQTKDFVDKVGILEANDSTIQAPKYPATVNETQSKDFDDKVGIFKANQSRIEGPKSPATVNQTQNKDFDDKVGIFKANQKQNSAPKSSSEEKSVNKNGEKGIAEKEVRRNYTSSLGKKQLKGTNLEKKSDGDLVKSLLNCDFFDGNWVTDESYPLYKPGSCSLIDEQFNCFRNDRPDTGYLKMKWKPKACSLPRLNATHMLELLRGTRLVFVGDSLNRNMWESLICILRNSVKNQKKVYEVSGRHHFRTEASYSFIFEEYKCRVEFFVSPFLVQQWEVADKKGGKKETLRLDLIGESADKYKDADILVFNTGHWWTHEKTSLGKDYYQEGSHVHNELNVLEAFRRALTTWGRWIDAHINPKKTFVLFRGYSASHFSGGQWNSGGACDSETEPIKNDTYLTPYPSKMTVLENVFKGMKTQVSYLNITRMSDYRKDGHPSIYRKPHLTDKERRSQWRYQDCSHWCLPGVPDAWNELLYAEILVRLHQKQQEKKS
ncbi:protein trichome birefringence-like [Lycium ferocissimum]|uniref:protein trichome birefringence-like n=1 Tax=Lycium ferocissimum TaxID=112874 RepID=UPI0028166A3C|nr:protein trichome birefringence-like [Lycium ferocissimum]